VRTHAMSFPLVLIIGLGVAACSACSACPAAECPPIPTSAPSPIPPTPTPALPKTVGRLHWFGVSSILYKGSKTIYFDPINIAGPVPPADIVLLSHAHGDHVDLESLQKIVKATTVMIISPNVDTIYDILKDHIKVDAIVLDEGETTDIGGVSVKAIPAYDAFLHPRAAKGMGYLVSVDGERIYFAGGTNYYPEMAEIESDVTIYPLYDSEDVMQAARILPTQVMVLVHCFPKDISMFLQKYGMLFGSVRILGLRLESYNP
jgi:L-ascorbate metabolism protein UlaG (beta-lactamase superfamily)